MLIAVIKPSITYTIRYQLVGYCLNDDAICVTSDASNDQHFMRPVTQLLYNRVFFTTSHTNLKEEDTEKWLIQPSNGRLLRESSRIDASVGLREIAFMVAKRGERHRRRKMCRWQVMSPRMDALHLPMNREDCSDNDTCLVSTHFVAAESESFIDVHQRI